MMTLAIGSCALVLILLFVAHAEHKARKDERAHFEKKIATSCQLGEAIRKEARNTITKWGIEHAEIREMDRKKRKGLADELTEVKSENRSLKDTAKADTVRWDHLDKENDKLKAELHETQLKLDGAESVGPELLFQPDLPERYGNPFNCARPFSVKNSGRYIGRYGEWDCWLGELALTGWELAIWPVNNLGDCRYVPVSDLDETKSSDWSDHRSDHIALKAAHKYLKDNNMLPRHTPPKDRKETVFLGHVGPYDAWFFDTLPEFCTTAGKPGIGLTHMGCSGGLCGYACGDSSTAAGIYKEALDLARERCLLPEEKPEPVDDFQPDAPQRYKKPASVGEKGYPRFVGQYQEYDCWLNYSKDEWQLFLTLFDGGHFAPSDVVAWIRPKSNTKKMVKVCESLKQHGMVPRYDPPKDQEKAVFLCQHGYFDVWFVKSMTFEGHCYLQHQSGIFAINPSHPSSDSRQVFMSCKEIDTDYRNNAPRIDVPAKAICAGDTVARERGLVPEEKPESWGGLTLHAPQRYEKPSCVYDHPRFVGQYQDYDCWLSFGHGYPFCLTMTNGRPNGTSWAASLQVKDRTAGSKFINVYLSLSDQGLIPRYDPPKDQEKAVFLCQHGYFDVWFVKSIAFYKQPGIYAVGPSLGGSGKAVIACEDINMDYHNDARPVAKAICAGDTVARERNLI